METREFGLPERRIGIDSYLDKWVYVVNPNGNNFDAGLVTSVDSNYLALNPYAVTRPDENGFFSLMLTETDVPRLIPRELASNLIPTSEEELILNLEKRNLNNLRDFVSKMKDQSEKRRPILFDSKGNPLIFS